MRFLPLLAVWPVASREAPQVLSARPQMRREGRKRRSSFGAIELEDDFCASLCQATDVSTVSKHCGDLSNEECVTAAFYESDAAGDRRLCALRGGETSISDPKAKDCAVDERRKCSKGQELCVEEVSKPSNVTACHFCGANEFLPQATAYMEDGKPFTCAHALDLINEGVARLSCQDASQELPDCCRPSQLEEVPEAPEAFCDLCAYGGVLKAAAVAMVLQGDPMSCREAQQKLSQGQAPVSCETAQRSDLVTRCCSQLGNCSICDEMPFLPNATVDLSTMAGGTTASCDEAVLSSSSCEEAKSRWSSSCCDQGTTTTTGEGSQEATPFCKSLCLKSDVSEWNMTCEELPQELCASTHFFQTVSQCERRLCVWTAKQTCAVDHTQACISCSWPCSKATTTPATTTAATSSTSTSSSADRNEGDEGPEAASPYLVDGEEVPSGCFDFCVRTDVRSMRSSCGQLTEKLCASGNFYQTDTTGNRRHCRFEMDECLVDEAFVCNASMPICPVEEELESGETEVQDGVQEEESRSIALSSFDAAARECLAAGCTEVDLWRIFNRSIDEAPMTLSNPAELAFKRALDMVLILHISLGTVEKTLRDSFITAPDAKTPVTSCESLSVQQCGDSYLHGINMSCKVQEERCVGDLSEGMCKSLCFKAEVSNCSAVSQCDRHYEKVASGYAPCKGPVGSCHASSNACSLLECEPTGSKSSERTTMTTTSVQIFHTGCPHEMCPEVSSSQCLAWKQSGRCHCHCKKYQPHVVMFLVSNLGFNDFADSTDMAHAWPYVNSILPQSILINTSYTALGSAPSRAAFLTGRHADHFPETPSMSADAAEGPEGWSPLGVSRHRQLGSADGFVKGEGEHTIAQKLATVGYKSYAVGKWQSGSVSWEMTPSGRGFSRFFGQYSEGADYVKRCDMNGQYDLHYEESEAFEVKNWTLPRPYHSFPCGKNVVGKHSNAIFQEKAEQFIRDHQEKYGKDGTPMFLYYAPMVFQEPLQAPSWTSPNCTEDEGFGSAANANRQSLCRMAVALDRSIERTAQAMAGAFPEDNWVMIIASDGGGSAAHRVAGGSNWPLRGSKGEVWEGGIRTKALVAGSHPELETAKSRGLVYAGGYMHLVDWHATILHLAHAAGVSDGESMWGALVNNTASPARDFMCNVSGAAALRSGNYKLIMASGGGRNPHNGEIEGIGWPVRNVENSAYMSSVENEGSWTEPRWQLFDLRSDPDETTDLATQMPQEVERLQRRYRQLAEAARPVASLDCGSACADLPRKAVAVMRKHAPEVRENPCPIQEPSYPYWEEAMELAQRPFTK